MRCDAIQCDTIDFSFSFYNCPPFQVKHNNNPLHAEHEHNTALLPKKKY